MVELSDPKNPVKEGIDNTIFIVPGIIIAILIVPRIPGTWVHGFVLPNWHQVHHSLIIPKNMEGAEEIPNDIQMEKPGSYGVGALSQPGMSDLTGILVAIIPGSLIGFFVFKLVKSLRDKEKAKEEKKKLKQMRKEKEQTKKQKKK